MGREVYDTAVSVRAGRVRCWRAVDLSPTMSESSFRDSVRTWLIENLPWEYGVGLPPRFDDLGEEVTFLRSWQARLAAGRWVGVSWPAAYGGRGAGPVAQFLGQRA